MKEPRYFFRSFDKINVKTSSLMLFPLEKLVNFHIVALHENLTRT